MSNISIQKVSSQKDLQTCLNIRKQVFVIGQQVLQHEELDGKDQESDHFLLVVDEQPAGVARVRYIGNFAKIERVAILSEYQGQGLGYTLMKTILSTLKESDVIVAAKLSSQVHAITFYEKLGFMVCSEEYMDANIPHQDMVLHFL